MSISIAFKRISEAITYDDFHAQFEQQATAVLSDQASDAEKDTKHHIELNWQRAKRIEKTYHPSQDLINQLQQLKAKQYWIVLTEAWCGDSAQCFGYIARIAQQTPLIELKILLRDSHLEIMDQYLTNNGRSIPKLIATDEQGNELFTWGPRPMPAMELFASLKKQNIEREKLYEQVHSWYAKDKGKTVEEEFKALLSPYCK